MLLFDLDGTLLTSDKTISAATLDALAGCRSRGMRIGVSTSRGEKNCMGFLPQLRPDVAITSGGALMHVDGEIVLRVEFSEAETASMIRTARQICGADVEITVDTPDAHYWNYTVDPLAWDKSWGGSIFTDYSDFTPAALKLCVQVFDPETAKRLAAAFPDCDCARFSGSDWYKFTKRSATKENAILRLREICGIRPEEIIAFGDDFSDIGMLKLCGTGVAMGNAIEAVKAAADCVIGDNDHDGIAVYLQEQLLK
ncbi:MAG: Cof-type HAD-IIB family hydrolase [Ruminococcaceae bacterium]|nr:Cof-type HAD-IIB family hydrolase [Oscillospiraceae bacterium]